MYGVEIKTSEKLTEVSESLYGLFFEDINRAGDGGLYAELLRNRAFDDGIVPNGCRYDPATKTVVSPTGWVTSFDCCEQEGVAGWEARNGAEFSLTDRETLNDARKRALTIRFGGGTVVNLGFGGIPVEKGKSYRFYMFAKSEEAVKVSVFFNGGEKRRVFEISGDYKKYECELTADVTDNNAELALFSESAAAVTLGFTSLFPKDTFMGRENGMRRSLAERLVKLRPAFLRFPGGCVVEGFSKDTVWRFADTIGPVWERRPHWLLWSYMTTNGLGFHEYLQFCEDLGIAAMYVLNCGMTCQGRCPDYFDRTLTEELYNDAVCAILYATAPADTEWGAKRAENGHAEPFSCLKYIEIGNENYGEEYFKRYESFYRRLKERFPQFTYISTDHTETVGLPTECVDEHFYSDPVFFVTNSDRYDSLDRNGPDIYCGEYAATVGCREGTLYGALGEAAFLTGAERNQDKVKMVSYAPLFKNVGYVSWEPDLIAFDGSRDHVIPSYHVLEMFAGSRGDYVCGHSVFTESSRRIESGCFSCGGTVSDGNVFNLRFGSRVSVRFWDKQRDGEDQDRYEWTVENGISKIVHYNGWSTEVICKDTPCELSADNSAELFAEGDRFRITLNGRVLHEQVIKPVPDLTGVCTVDIAEGVVFTKLVNFSAKEIFVKISCDVQMEDKARHTGVEPKPVFTGIFPPILRQPHSTYASMPSFGFLVLTKICSVKTAMHPTANEFEVIFVS